MKMEKLKSRKKIPEALVEKVKSNPAETVRNILMLLYALVLSRGAPAVDISPFGIALITAVPREYFPWAFIGACAGYASNQSIAGLIKYISLMIIIRLFLVKITKEKSFFDEIWFVPPVIVFSFTFVGGFITSLFTGFSLEALGQTTCEALAGAVSVYFLKRCFANKYLSEGFCKMKREEAVCVIFCGGLFILSLSSVNIFDVSLAKITAGTLILLCSFYFGEACGFICGVVCGISMGIHSSSAFDIVSASLCGLMAGVFSPLGRWGSVSAFLITQLSVFLFSDEKIEFVPLLAECALSVIFFFVTPQKFIASMKKYIGSFPLKNSGENTAVNYSEKLSDASDCLKDISNSVNKISSSLKKLNDASDKSIYCRVQSEVCKSCRKYGICWEKDYASTYKKFEKVASLFRENERVEKNRLPGELLNSCVNTDRFLSVFEKNYRQNRARHEDEIRVTNMRDIFYDQLNCMSDTLRDFSTEFLKTDTGDPATAMRIKEHMKDLKIDVNFVSCKVGGNGAMTVEAHCRRIDESTDRHKLTQGIEELTLRKFEDPEITYSEKGIKVLFRQKPLMSLKIGTMQYPGEGSSICGDYIENFCEKGKHTIIISDGMGTGGRAAVDSAMTAEFFGKLIKSGFSKSSALKIVNSAMLVKSSYESLSTIDSATIDLFTGKLELFKAGAAVSFIRKNGKCIVAENSSLPIGILREIEFAGESLTLSPGDMLLMVSDGVTANGVDWIIEEIEKMTRDDPDRFAQKIALRSAELYSNIPNDDITVMAALIS